MLGLVTRNRMEMEDNWKWIGMMITLFNSLVCIISTELNQIYIYIYITNYIPHGYIFIKYESYLKSF